MPKIQILLIAFHIEKLGYGKRLLTIWLMNSEEHPLKRETFSMYGKYNVWDICQK